ncbi:MAG: hypothetical protein LBM26_02555 [Methanobrevibacter sp.]|nr:hypothetical protein [Methanobrevibacter sp.]
MLKKMWDLGYIGVIIGIITIIVFGKILVDNKMSFGNAISMCGSAVAILSVLFAQYRNEKNIEKQLNKADNRLDTQMIEAKDRLTIQMDKADERLTKQLTKQESNLKKQLEYQESNLKKQLIFDKQQEVLLEIHDILFKNQFANETIYCEFSNRDDYCEIIFRDRKSIYFNLTRIKKDIKQFNYIPKQLREELLEFTQYVKKQHDDNYSQLISGQTYHSKFSNEAEWNSLSSESEDFCVKKINNISKLVEEELGVEIKR